MDTLDFDNNDESQESEEKNDNFEEQIRQFKDRLKDGGGGSTNIEALEEIVSFYFENEKYEEALHFITLLLEYIPFSADTWQRKGVILNNLQRHEEALECFDQALNLNPVDTELIIGRGLTLDNFGRYDEALACFDRG